MIAQGKPPFGRETLNEMTSLQTANATVAKVRASIERLRKRGCWVAGPPGELTLDDPLLEQYLFGGGFVDWWVVGKDERGGGCGWRGA